MAITDKLAAVADAIRGKTGKAELMTLDQMPGEIEGIQAGGGDIKALVERTITEVDDDTFEVIGGNAFSGCNNMTKINVPSAKIIVNDAFAYCGQLREVNIPLVTEIGQRAFKNNTVLTAIYLPSVIFLDQYAFYACPKLKAVVLSNTESMCSIPSYSRPFDNTPLASGNGYFYAPRKFLSDSDETMDYRRATNWTVYGAAQFRVLEDYTVDGTVTGKLDESKI